MAILENIKFDDTNNCVIMSDGTTIKFTPIPDETIMPDVDINTVKTEAEFQSVVVRTAESLGWWYYHTYDSRRCPAGWPDLVLIKPPVCIFVELKMELTKTTDAQRMVLDMLADCGQEVYVWRPGDWDRIIARLSDNEPTQRPTRLLHRVSNMYDLGLQVPITYDVIENPPLKCVKCEHKGALGAKKKLVVYKDALGKSVYAGYICEPCLKAIGVL